MSHGLIITGRQVATKDKSFLLAALLTLLAATWVGLLRIGWVLPATSSLAAAHGPLMVSGFLGARIGLERGGAGWARTPLDLQRADPRGQPGVDRGLRRDHPPTAGRLYLHLGVRRDAVGGRQWAVAGGVAVLRGRLGWAGYLVLISAGERLELARLTRLPRIAMIVFFPLLAAYVAGLPVLSLTPRAGVGQRREAGAACLLLMAWLTRFIAVNLLLG